MEDNTRPSGEWSADNPHRKRAGEALGDTVRKQFAWEMEQGHWENVSNRALYESLSDKERQNILPLLSMARGEVKGPQFWADLWTRLATSADRTFGNPFRYLGSLAGDVSTPIGAWLTGRDFDYGKWAAGKKEQAKAEAMLIASTRRMTYGDYGILTEGILGTIEQLPIFAVTSAGAALAPATGGASVYGSAAFLALGYAEDTRQAALERGADPFAASLLGLASGAVQGAIDQIQWSQLAGLADSALLSVAKRNAAAAFSRSFAQGAVRRVGSAALLSAAQRVGSAYLTDVFLECAQEGLQGMTDSLTQDLALGLSGDASVDAKGALARALARFGEEFVQSLPTMLVTVGLAGGTHVVRETARGASAGRALHDLRVGRAQTLPLIEAKGLNATELRQRWRTTQGDAARVTLLTEALGSRNAAETAHALFKAEETLANRHRTLAIQQLVDMSSRAGARFAGDPKAIQDMLRGLGLDATVTQAKLADTDRDGKAVSRDGFLVRLRVGDKTIDLGLRAATEAEVSLDGSAASATSAWEAVSKVNAEVSKMGKGAFITRWQADADFRQGLTQKHRLASSGLFAVRPGLSVIVSRTNPETGAVERDTLPVGGLILLAQGGLSGEAVATNRSLAHETLHAITRLLRDGGVLTADGDLVKQARRVFGDPKVAGELFDEEAAAHRLAEESGLGMEAVDAMAGEVLRAIPDKGVRGLLRRAAGAFMDWLAGGDVVPVVDEKGRVTELSGDSRALGEVKDKASRGQRFFTALANALDDHAAEASEAWGKLQASRAAARQATLDALAREQVAKAPAAAEKAETAATEEERQDALREKQAAEAALDAALREQAEARDEQAARQLFALRGYLDEADRKNPDPKAVIPTLADSFAKLCRQPLPTKPAERNRALADRRAALKKWRDAKNRELDLLKLRAALGVDPAARLEYYVARENEAFRLEAREARKSIDDEKRRVKETPVAEGDALLANTRAVGHVEVESRESFVKRKMAENGWDRKTAIAQSTHLYPEDMQGLGVPPWASKQLYTGAGGHSPDTAAQALYDEGRIADPTVDAFWEAVRGDIETVSLSKQREIEAIEAEAAQAVERALALHRASLADIEQRDAEGGLPLPGDVRREVTAQGNAGADWTKWDNAEKLRRIRATRVIEIDTPTEGEVVGLLADYRVFAKGYRARIAKWATEGQVAPANTNAYIGDIRTTKTSIKDIVSHGYGPLKVLVIPHLDEILQNAAPYSRGEDTKKGLRFINLAHRLTFEGEQLMAFITVQEDVNGNRTYDVEFGDEKRLSRELPIGAGAGETAHANPDSLDTTSVPQSGDNVNPRREVSGLFSGGPVPYDQPSLRAVGSNDGGKVYGWGLYADKVFDVARAFAEGPTAAIHEQRWWTHRAPGDESHLLDWELEVTPENRARVLAAVRSLDVTEEELRQIFGRDWATRGMTGEQAYELVVDAVRFFTEADESERAASELLVAFDIDGVHTRDDRSSTYVAFSDEHLQVVRRWVWDAATETFVPDASFLPPAPTSAEAQGRAQAVATVRREATGVLLDAVNENRARFGLESLPADYSPAPRREVTAAGPHANEPFTYAKSALRKRVDRAQMEGEGTNPIGKRDIVELTDIPPFWLDYGFQNGRLFTIADILRKIKKEHHIDASAFAELPEHYSRPVAILIQNEEWTILTDQLADDGTGRLAPVMLYVRQAKDGTNAYLASAYSRDVAGESAYINKANAGGLLYLDDIRIDALPLAGETKKALLEKWHSGKRTGAPFGPQEELNRSIQTSGESAFTSDNQGNTNTIAQPRANVNPQAAFDEARRRLEVSALYYGRSPEAAELSDRAIAEFAVAEEALRTGKKPSQAQVSQAFADFGLHPGEQSGRSARRTLKLLNDLGLTYDKDGNAVAVPKGALSGLLSRNERLRGAFDSAWSEAEAEAFSKGAASAFAAARGMAAETQALAKAHRDEAEAVLGMDPGILQAELGFDIEATLLADKAKWQKLTPAQAEAAAKKREEERQKAIEEAEAAAQALQDGTPPREPSLEELGLDEAGIAKLRERRDELRKRWAEIDREAEAKRLERKLKREAEALDKEDDKEDDKDALLARKLERLKGVAFDIDDPVSVREFVNLVILHVAERRAGTTFAAPVQFNRQLTDPLTVRDAARTLAQILSEMADRLAYGAARERVKKSAMRLTMAETIGQTRALAVGAFASLRNAMVRESQTEMRDQMVKAIDAVTQSGAFAVGREDSERRVTGDLERRLRAIKQALTLGALGRARLREEAMAKLSGLQADRTLDADALCSMRDYLDAQRVIVSLNEYGGWRQMGLGELADLRDRLLRLVQTGLDEHERRIQQFEARVARITEPILAALNQNPPETKPGRHSKKAERLAAWLDEHLGLQNLLFETLLSRATGEVRAKGARAVRELLAAFTEASVTYEARKQVWQREAQNIITRVYGSVTAWQNRMREAIDDDHRKRISNRRTESQEQAGADPAQKTALTRGQVLQLYASVIQPDYALNARLHRRDGDCLEAMRECLDARDLQFLAEMSAFFRKIFPDLRDAYKAVTGVTVGTTPGYWPVRINYEREGLPARVRAWSPIVAAMEPRRRNSLDFREDVSVEEMVWGRIDDWAHMMGYGQMGILARAVLGDRHLREAIRNSLGDKLAKRIQDNVLDALLGPETDPGAGFLLIGARYTSGMSMALNVGVMLKQFAGIPAFAHAVGGRKTLRFWWAGVAKDAAFDRDWAILTQSPSFKARYGAGLNAEMKAALAGGEPGGFTGRASRFYSWGLQWQAWADKIVCRPFAVGAFREYRDAYLREGMAEDEAVRRAVIDAWAMVEATQQSSRPENQLRSVNKNRFFRYLAQFRSAPLQSLQWELRAFSAMLRGEEGARARFIRAVVVNHVFAPMFYIALDALWNEVILLGFLDDDDEEKERRYKRYCAEFALQFLFGQLPAVPLYGNAFEVFYQWLLKNARRKKEGRDLADLTARELAQEMVDIPVVRTEANLAAAAASLAKDLCTLDLRNAASEIDDFAKSALSPYRDIQKAVRNLSGHDLADLWEE